MTFKTANRLLLTLALVLLAFHTLVYTVYAVNLMQFPFDYDQGEGFEMVDTLLFSQWQLPYRNTDVYPFYSSNYPPLFHVIAAPFAAVFGAGYWYGRLLGYLGTLLTAAAIGLAVYREGRHRWVAVLSGLAFLASNTVYHVGPLFRQHMTMVMFETLAVVVLANANEIPDTRRRRWTLAAGLLLALAAGYTKQLAYATAIAIGIFLMIRQPRRAFFWGLFAAGVGGGAFLWLNVATEGQWWRQAIQANINDYDPLQTLALFRLWFSLHGFLLVPAALYVVYELYFSRLSLYTLWFLVATVNNVSAGKWGGGDSYFATSIAALCILSGIVLGRWLNGTLTLPEGNPYSRLLSLPRRFAPALTAAALVIVPLLYAGYARATLKMPTDGALFGALAGALGIQPNVNGRFYDSARTADGQYAGGYADIGHLTTQADVEAGWRIVARIRASGGPVLSEEAAFALLTGQTVVTNPTQLLNLYANNLFNPSALVAMLDAQAFSLIVLRAQFYPEPVLQAIWRSYQLDETVVMNGFEYLILIPKP